MKSQLDHFYRHLPNTTTQWLLRAALMLLFFTSSLLLLPENTLESLRLAGWAETNRPILSLTLLVISSGIFAKFVALGIKLAEEQLRAVFRQRKAKAKLQMLDNDERALLREFFLRRSSSLPLPYQHPVVQRLLDSFVLTPDHQLQVEEENYRRAFCISDEARPYITGSRLQLPVYELTENDIRYLKASRPDFLQSNRAA